MSEGSNVPTIICKGNKVGEEDEYEDFLNRGKRLYESNNLGWNGIELEGDENTGMALCYTSGENVFYSS